MNDFVLGLLTALVGWFLVTVALRPRLTWQADLRRFQADPQRLWHYAYIRNRMPWKAVDVYVLGRLRVQGTYSHHPGRWATFDLAVDDPIVPILKGTLRSTRTGISRATVLRTGSARQGFRILMEELPDRLTELLPETNEYQSDLERLLSLGNKSELYFVAFVTDGISGTRTAYESRHYTLSSLPAPSKSDSQENDTGAH